MKLNELKKIIDQASVYAADTDPDVEIWEGDTFYEIKRIGQFGILPNVIIHIKKKSFDGT